ncbi:MAG TPA: alpha/beta hydrolase fold domain-containing protein, partial [Amaricoccus sp.]|nr:alpha/beta hydrolase fold domain-containing protein [Amaricoccus sp.]
VFLRVREKPYLARETDFARARARMEREAALLPAPPGAALREASLGGVPALRIDGPEGGPVILWLHGGAYCLGSPRTHAAMVGDLARRAGMGVLLPDYRLAPEHRFPAAVEDARAAWDALVAEGVPPARIALGGDSAGGGLAFALLAALLAEGVAPAALVAFSPWVDLTLSGASHRRLARRDALLPAERLPEVRDLYLAGADPADPRASPHRAAFPAAPPVLIQASRDEILADDARLIAARLRAEGAPVALDLVAGVPHVWQFWHGYLPEADAAMDRAAGFLRRVLPPAGAVLAGA